MLPAIIFFSLIKSSYINQGLTINYLKKSSLRWGIKFLKNLRFSHFLTRYVSLSVRLNRNDSLLEILTIPEKSVDDGKNDAVDMKRKFIAPNQPLKRERQCAWKRKEGNDDEKRLFGMSSMRNEAHMRFLFLFS